MAFALILDVARGVSAGDRFVRRGDWSQQRFGIHHRVYGKRLGILGMGRIGHAVARRGTAFDMQVSYHKRKPVEGSPYLNTESVHGLAQWADFLIVTVAGGEQTRHLIDANVLDALGPTAFLINVARGSVVDERALVHALQDGRIAGAGLDVYEDDHAHSRVLKRWTTLYWLLTSAAARTRRGMQWRIGSSKTSVLGHRSSDRGSPMVSCTLVRQVALRELGAARYFARW